MIQIRHPNLAGLAQLHYNYFFVGRGYEQKLWDGWKNETVLEFRNFYRFLYMNRYAILTGAAPQLHDLLERLKKYPGCQKVLDAFKGATGKRAEKRRGDAEVALNVALAEATTAKQELEQVYHRVGGWTYEVRQKSEIAIQKTAEVKEKQREFNFLAGIFRFVKDLTGIFDYDGFCELRDPTQWGAYRLVLELKLDVCPYCNRQFTTTLKPKPKSRQLKRGGQKVEFIEGMRAQFDHYYAKSLYPFFGVSLFNLIPSCTVCNVDAKRRKEFAYDTHLHPYDDEVDQDVKFTVKFPLDPSGNPKKPRDYLGIWFGEPDRFDFTIGFKTNPNRGPYTPQFERRMERTITDLRLRELYQAHKDYIAELILKSEVYSDALVSYFYTMFPELFRSEDEILRMVFGNYVKETDLSKRPLAKLTRDIAEEFGLLN